MSFPGWADDDGWWTAYCRHSESIRVHYVIVRVSFRCNCIECGNLPGEVDFTAKGEGEHKYNVGGECWDVHSLRYLYPSLAISKSGMGAYGGRTRHRQPNSEAVLPPSQQHCRQYLGILTSTASPTHFRYFYLGFE